MADEHDVRPVLVPALDVLLVMAALSHAGQFVAEELQWGGEWHPRSGEPLPPLLCEVSTAWDVLERALRDGGNRDG